MEPAIGPFSIYIEFYFELSTCRSNVTLSPISFTDIHNFATIKEIEDFDEFHYLMRTLDSCYLKIKERKDGSSNSNKSN